MTETVSQAVERAQAGPGALIDAHAASFVKVLPTHVAKPEQWLRLAQSAIRRGRKTGNRYDLEIAAENNPVAFLGALMECARLGHEPGSDDFYLIARKQKGGRTEIQGIEGYQGIIERMYRAGAVASVVCEVVYQSDGFDYRPGRDDRPLHDIDWDAEDRGPLRLAYAYAVMHGGAVSKVVVLNRHDMARIRGKATGANSEYSPWNTDEPAMWLKSAARQLRKWTPTSAEYMRQQVQVAAAVAAEVQVHPELAPPPPGVDADGVVTDWDADDEGRPFDEADVIDIDPDA